MTECEICGATIVGKAQFITIGSSQLRVCRACARYGTSVSESQPAKARTQLGGFTSEQEQLARAKQRLYEQMDHELAEELEIPEDFGRRIKEARERVGLKQAELAQRINEKESLLRKIEHEEIMPTDEVRAKLERVLKISL
ncbi:MAG: TIGR00270 family protein [Methanomicrobia archaeon]|nr:TIGR00270 family protein [Methanomicrobia archaeon]